MIQFRDFDYVSPLEREVPTIRFIQPGNKVGVAGGSTASVRSRTENGYIGQVRERQGARAGMAGGVELQPTGSVDGAGRYEAIVDGDQIEKGKLVPIVRSFPEDRLGIFR